MSPRPLIERIARTPHVFDAAAAARAREALTAAPGLAHGLAQALGEGGPARALIDGVTSCAPYLARAMTRRPDALARLLAEPPEASLARNLDAMRRAGAEAEDVDALMARLRTAKSEAHLACALADIAGAWDVFAVIEAITATADAATKAALAGLARLEAARGRLPAPGEGEEGPLPGYFVLAMGKHGAGELNYSSDIDLIIFFDRDRFVARGVSEPHRAAVRLTQNLARVLQEVTAEGYVFRVDLRLRPDAGATAPAIATEAGLRYYESLGQSWERAALIKARPCAGDLPAGEAFLQELAPFIWRRSLDYAALEDIHATMRQIRGLAGGAARAPGADVKRGRGGIREIEFFAQAQQLIFGGRDASLRKRKTADALDALVAAGHVPRDVADDLVDCYAVLRELEHRLQMIEDQQTHEIPEDARARARVAALCGFEDASSFDADVEARFGTVRALTGALFADDETRPPDALVFDSVDDPPELLAALAERGFTAPQTFLAAARGWRAGRIPATRSPRAQDLLTRFLPILAEAAAASGAPDLAVARFTTFFERLPAGVQILSLFVSEPELVGALLGILALAPRLADDLARQPAALEVMLDAAFMAPLEEPDDNRLGARARAAIARAPDFEAALNEARRAAREERFRVGALVLMGAADASVAGPAYADLADGVIEGLSAAARAEVVSRHGRIAGDFAVLGLGKLGGRELSATSDLDVMLVYDVEDAVAMSDGARPLPADGYFARLTQRLIAALSAPTEEGLLYEVDMQLRPSGSAGPIAVRRQAFERYYEEDAWTWELMALTRARPVAGGAGVRAWLCEHIAQVLRRPRDPARLAADVAEMRAKVAAERPAAGPWDLKLARGGVMDVEFAAQFLQLAHAARLPQALSPSTTAALANLAASDAAPEADMRALLDAARLQLDLAQVLRLALDAPFDPDAAPEPLRNLLARAGGADSFAALEARLFAVQAAAREAYERVVEGAAG